MIPLIILIVLYTASLTLAAVLNGEQREISFSSTLIRMVIEGLLICWLVNTKDVVIVYQAVNTALK